MNRKLQAVFPKKWIRFHDLMKVFPICRENSLIRLMFYRIGCMFLFFEKVYRINSLLFGLLYSQKNFVWWCMFLFIGWKIFWEKNFEKKISEEGGCLEMGCVEGDGGLWMVKQGYRVECSAVATLRDVRLFRCKRFEGIRSAVGGIGTFTKKGLLFRLRSYCFGSLYRE